MVKRARGLPRLPKEVYGPAGPVLVVRKRRLTAEDGKRCDGLYVEGDRTIYLDSALRLRYAWPTLLHEQMHCWLMDMRYAMSEKLEEDLCNHLANCRMQLIWKALEKGQKVIV